MQESWQCGLLISKDIWTEVIEKGKFCLSIISDIGASPFSLCKVT